MKSDLSQSDLTLPKESLKFNKALAINILSIKMYSNWFDFTLDSENLNSGFSKFKVFLKN